MKNEAKLKNLGLENSVRYYYLKFGNKGVATVCVIKNWQGNSAFTYVRGVAYCNPKDQFVRKHGRAVALGRAVKAIEAHQFTEPISDTTPAVILKAMGWSYFSCWNPILTEYEQKLFREQVKEV